MRNGGGVKMGWAGVDPGVWVERPLSRVHRLERGRKIMRIKCSVFIMEIK